MADLIEIIQREYSEFSPSERRIANFILSHQDDLATYNSVELSKECQTSKATISRLFKRLGFKSFRDARNAMRDLRRAGVPMARDASLNNESLTSQHFASEISNIERLQSLLQHQPLDQIVSALSEARKIAVIGFRNAYPVALHLRQQLIQSRDQVNLLPQPGQTLGEDLVDYGDSDLVVVMAFHRRPEVTKRLIQVLSDHPARVIIFAEENSGLNCRGSDWLFEIPLETVSAFDSYALPMSMVSLLSNQVFHRRLEQGQQRVTAINELYDELNELDLS